MPWDVRDAENLLCEVWELLLEKCKQPFVTSSGL